jgi:hypothetical protein
VRTISSTLKPAYSKKSLIDSNLMVIFDSIMQAHFLTSFSELDYLKTIQ